MSQLFVLSKYNMGSGCTGTALSHSISWFSADVIDGIKSYVGKCTPVNGMYATFQTDFSVSTGAWTVSRFYDSDDCTGPVKSFLAMAQCNSAVDGKCQKGTISSCSNEGFKVSPSEFSQSQTGNQNQGGSSGSPAPSSNAATPASNNGEPSSASSTDASSPASNNGAPSPAVKSTTGSQKSSANALAVAGLSVFGFLAQLF